MFPSIKCTQTFVNGPLMSVLSKDGGLTFVHVTQRTVIPISLQQPIDLIRIHTVGLERACDGGSFGGNNLYLKRFHASASL